MLRNYILTALRSFSRQKIYSLINVSGLALGIASALLIFLYISDELSYDTIHPQHQQIYRLGHVQTGEDGTADAQPFAPGAWGQEMKAQYPEVLECTRAFWFGYPVAVNNEERDKILLTENLRWVENTYADLLYFDAVVGNREEAFKAPNAIAINESTAGKLFGDVNPLGKSLKITHPVTQGQELIASVAAVFKDYPDNVHIRPDYLLNVEILRPVFGDFFDQIYRGWDNFGPETYFRVEAGADMQKLEQGLTTMIHEHQAEAPTQDAPIFRKITALHFDSSVTWVNEGAGDINYIYIFSSIGLLILLIAAINYMNLATARSTKRAMEIGLRKTLGGNRGHLISQFFGESVVTTLISSILALVFVALALPLFNQLAHKTFGVAQVFSPVVLMALLLISVFVAIVAGLYPALYLSRFEPVEVLKGRFSSGKGSERFRKVLVVIQFSISIVLIICTAVMLNQMHFISQSKLNQHGDQMLSIRFGGNASFDKYPTLRSELLKDGDISEVTIANHLPRQEYFGSIDADFRFPSANGNEYNWSLLNTDYSFADVFDLEILSGRPFEQKDNEVGSNYLISESGAKTLGLNYEDLIGLSVVQTANDTSFTGQIIGVFKDFPFRSMREEVEPLLLTTRPNPIDQIVYVKLPGNQVGKKIAEVEKTWKAVFPDVGFDYWFINDEFSRMYVGEERISALTRVFALLGLIVACLGVYGLASFLVDRKTKEIGVRKILGAQLHHIVNLLSRTFMITILIASLIGIPVSYFLMQSWLENFVYHVGMSFWVFALAVGLVLMLAWLSVSFVTMRAARTNPIQFIRDE